VNDFEQKVVCGRPSSDVSLASDSQSNDPRAIPSAHQQSVSPKLPSALRADCSRCAGLCCVVHAFYSVQGFAFDKPAHSACRYLTLENRCAIHTGLASRGFPGCVAFDCYGAGQRVTQELLNGMSWRTSDETAIQNLFSAYTAFLALHRLMAMLELAEATVSAPLDTQMRLKREQLNDLCRSEEAKRGNLDIARLQSDVLELIQSCREAWLTPGRVLAKRGDDAARAMRTSQRSKISRPRWTPHIQRSRRRSSLPRRVSKARKMPPNACCHLRTTPSPDWRRALK
jgi:hypothetical protein